MELKPGKSTDGGGSSRENELDHLRRFWDLGDKDLKDTLERFRQGDLKASLRRLGYLE